MRRDLKNGAPLRRDKLIDILEHLSKHRHRMRYHELRADDLDIATGAVEGAVRPKPRAHAARRSRHALESRSLRTRAPPPLHLAQRPVG